MGCIFDVIRLKWSAKVAPVQGCKQKPPLLTRDQKAVIKNNWHILKMYFATVGVNTFIRLFESKPELQEAFKEFRGKGLKELRFTGLLRKHSLRVMATIDKCIINLDDPSFIIPSLLELGMQHANNDVPVDYVESILPPFLDTIKPYIENHWCTDTEQAWEKMFSWILYYIKEGMLQKCNKT